MGPTMPRQGVNVVSDPGLQLIFTIVFAALAGYFLIRIGTDRDTGLQAFGHTLHVIMALDMAAMSWEWWFIIPPNPQLVFFTGATAWYLLMFILQAVGKIPPEDLGGHAAWHQFVHTIMMLTMVWMVAVMHPFGDHQAHGHGHHTIDGWLFTAGVVFTASLLIFTFALLIEFSRANVELQQTALHKTPGTFGSQAEVLAMALMTLGMGAMSWLMLAM